MPHSDHHIPRLPVLALLSLTLILASISGCTHTNQPQALSRLSSRIATQPQSARMAIPTTTRPSTPLADVLNLDPIFAGINPDLPRQLYQREQRDRQIDALSRTLASLHPGQTMQCLWVEGIEDSVPPKRGFLLVVHATQVAAVQKAILAPVEPVFVSDREWAFLRPLAEDVTAHPHNRRHQRPRSVAIIGYYDGEAWRRSVWFNTDYSPDESSVALKRLTGAVWLLGNILFVGNPEFDESTKAMDDFPISTGTSQPSR